MTTLIDQERKALIAAAREVVAAAKLIAADDPRDFAVIATDEAIEEAEAAYVAAGGPTGFQGWAVVLDDAYDAVVNGIREGTNPYQALVIWISSWEEEN